MGRVRGTGTYIALALALLGVWSLVFASKFGGLADPNAMDFAQIARHLARGDGYVTSFVRPLSLAIVPHIQDHPELSQPPLYVGWLALLFKLAGPSDRVAAIASGIMYLLAVAAVFFVTRAIFDHRTAVITAVLGIINVPLLKMAISGLEVTMAALLVTLLAFFLWLAARSSTRGLLWFGVAGATLGLIVLTKELFVAILPAAVYFIIQTRRDVWLKATGVLVAAFLAVQLPWFVRNAIVTHNPFFTLEYYEAMMRTDVHPGQTLYRELPDEPPSPLTFAFSKVFYQVKKFQRGLNALYTSGVAAANVYVGAFFLVGLLRRFDDRPRNVLKWSLMAMFALQIAVLCLIQPIGRFLIVFVPIMTAFAVDCLLSLVDRYAERAAEMPRRQRLVRGSMIAAFMAVAAYPVLVLLFVTNAAQPTRAPEMVKPLTVSQDRVVVTDIPWAASWYSDRIAIWAPQTPGDLAAVHELAERGSVSPDAIYLWPTVLVSYSPVEQMGYWQATYASRKPPDGYALAEQPEDVPGCQIYRPIAGVAPTEVAATASARGT